MGQYVYVLTPVRATFPGDVTDEERAIIGEHFARLERLHADGTMIHVGRCEDATFGLAIFNAASDDAAAELMRDNPVIVRGVMTATLHPYRVVLHGNASVQRRASHRIASALCAGERALAMRFPTRHARKEATS